MDDMQLGNALFSNNFLFVDAKHVSPCNRCCILCRCERTIFIGAALALAFAFLVAIIVQFPLVKLVFKRPTLATSEHHRYSYILWFVIIHVIVCCLMRVKCWLQVIIKMCTDQHNSPHRHDTKRPIAIAHLFWLTNWIVCCFCCFLGHHQKRRLTVTTEIVRANKNIRAMKIVEICQTLFQHTHAIICDGPRSNRPFFAD